MRGRQTDPKKVEEVKAIAATTANLLETSRQTGVPVGTVHAIVNSDDEFEKYRKQAQREYILTTWSNIQSISKALTDYIDAGKLTTAQLRELTGALKDLRTTVENVVNNIHIGDNVQINYNADRTEELIKQYILENQDKVKEWLSQ